MAGSSANAFSCATTDSQAVQPTNLELFGLIRSISELVLSSTLASNVSFGGAHAVNRSGSTGRKVDVSEYVAESGLIEFPTAIYLPATTANVTAMSERTTIALIMLCNVVVELGLETSLPFAAPLLSLRTLICELPVSYVNVGCNLWSVTTTQTLVLINGSDDATRRHK